MVSDRLIDDDVELRLRREEPRDIIHVEIAYVHGDRAVRLGPGGGTQQRERDGNGGDEAFHRAGS